MKTELQAGNDIPSSPGKGTDDSVEGHCKHFTFPQRNAQMQETAA